MPQGFFQGKIFRKIDQEIELQLKVISFFRDYDRCNDWYARRICTQSAGKSYRRSLGSFPWRWKDFTVNDWVGDLEPVTLQGEYSIQGSGFFI